MKPDIVAEIDRVLALAELATPGEWATVELFPGSVYCDDATGSIVANCYGFTRVVRSDEECIANATVIPAAVNLIRNPDLRRLVENGLRYEWLRGQLPYFSGPNILVLNAEHENDKFSASDYLEGEALDRAIDTARAQGGGHG